MAARPSPGGGPGGGQGVPAIRPARASLIAAAAAAALGAPSLWYVAAQGGGLAPAWLLPITAVGLLALLAGGLTSTPGLAACAPFLLGGPVALTLWDEGATLLAVPLGVSILLATELAFLAADLARKGRWEPSAVGARVLRTGGMALAGAAASTVVLGIGGVPASGGLDLTLLGVGSALLLVLGVGLLARGRLRS